MFAVWKQTKTTSEVSMSWLYSLSTIQSIRSLPISFVIQPTRNVFNSAGAKLSNRLNVNSVRSSANAWTNYFEHTNFNIISITGYYSYLTTLCAVVENLLQRKQITVRVHDDRWLWTGFSRWHQSNFAHSTTCQNARSKASSIEVKKSQHQHENNSNYNY